MIEAHARLICGECKFSIDTCDKCGQPLEPDEKIGCNGEDDHICSDCVSEKQEAD